jgi:hypothetical protein
MAVLPEPRPSDPRAWNRAGHGCGLGHGDLRHATYGRIVPSDPA